MEKDLFIPFSLDFKLTFFLYHIWLFFFSVWGWGHQPALPPLKTFLIKVKTEVGSVRRSMMCPISGARPPPGLKVCLFALLYFLSSPSEIGWAFRGRLWLLVDGP